MPFEKPGHPLPGLIGAGDVVGRAALVEERMRRVVAEDLRRLAGRLHRRFQLVDGLRGAPVVAVREMALKRRPDPGRIGELLRRNTVEAYSGGEVRDMH